MIEPRNSQEAAEWYATLNTAEQSVIALLRDGWLLVSDQYTGKTWIERAGETKKLPRKVREYNEFEINLWSLLEVSGDWTAKTTDGRGLIRRYERTAYRINRYAKSATEE